MTLEFTSAAWSKLNTSSAGSALSAHTSTTAIAPASANGSAFTFPVTGGSLDLTHGDGNVTASGGISIASGGTNPFFASSTSASVMSPVAALGSLSALTVTSENFSPPTVTLLGLGTSGAKLVPRGRRVTISDVQATVAAAGQQFFGVGGPFNVGEEIGKLTIKASG